MKYWKWLLSIVVVAVIAYGGYEFGKRTSTDNAAKKTASPTGDKGATNSAGPDSSASSEPIATVHVAAIRKDQITEELSFFGSVVTRQEKVKFVSAPLESRLRRILVTPGQRVKKDDNLFELDLSPAASLAVAQAKINATSANAELQQMQTKFNEKLATNQELTQASQAASLANGSVKQLEQLYAEAVGLHPSGFNGVVSKIDAQPGQIVVPGAPIIEVVSDDGIELELGVEIEDVRMLKLDETVKVSAVLADHPHDIDGIIRLITETIDPQTRLTRIYVSLPAQAGFMLGESVKAIATIKTPVGMVVPRQAVIPDGSTDIIFIVEKGRAVEKRVRSGVDNGGEIEIFSDTLKPGDQVVTVGGSQLTDGMRVRIAKETQTASPSVQSDSASSQAPQTNPVAPTDESKNKREPQP